MSEKHVLANKRRWAKIPKIIRTKCMSALAKQRAEKMTKKERSEHGRMMRREQIRKLKVLSLSKENKIKINE